MVTNFKRLLDSVRQRMFNGVDETSRDHVGVSRRYNDIVVNIWATSRRRHVDDATVDDLVMFCEVA